VPSKIGFALSARSENINRLLPRLKGYGSRAMSVPNNVTNQPASAVDFPF
jgi:hypothetical protein